MDDILLCYFSYKGDYVPLDIGYALAKAKQRDYHSENMKIVALDFGYLEYEDDPLDREVRRLIAQNPRGVIFFVENILWSSVFAWKRARDLAGELKKVRPDLTIGIQSYKATDSQVDTALQSGSVDFVIRDNPEEVLPNLDKVLDKKNVPGVYYLHNTFSSEEKRRKNVQAKAKANSADTSLDDLPSPYLSGAFDEYLKKEQLEKAGKFSAFIYTSRGCVFGCYYCWRSARSDRNVDFFSAARVYSEIEYLYEKHHISSFFIIDDAFPYSRARLKSFLSEFKNRKKKNPNLDNIHLRIMCRLEMLNHENISLLQKLNVVWVQIGLQTVNPTLQHYMNRKVEIERFKEVAGLLRESRIDFMFDVIAGLPGDSIRYFKKTIDFAVGLAPSGMQVNWLFINPGALFFLKRSEYGIEISQYERDFYAPMIIKAKGIDGKYIAQAKVYVSKKIIAYPKIWWQARFQ